MLHISLFLDPRPWCMYVWCTYQWSWPLILMHACVYDEYIIILDPDTSMDLWCMCMRVRGVPWAWRSSRTRLGLIILIMGGKSFQNCFLQRSDWSNLSINPSRTFLCGAQFERSSVCKNYPDKSNKNTSSLMFLTNKHVFWWIVNTPTLPYFLKRRLLKCLLRNVEKHGTK